MSSSEDIEYYARRAEAEREHASKAPTREIAAIHERLATHYEAHVELLQGQQVVQSRAANEA